jgi:hypothetical protein
MIVPKSLLDESALPITCLPAVFEVIILSCTLPPLIELLGFRTKLPALLVESLN